MREETFAMNGEGVFNLLTTEGRGELTENDYQSLDECFIDAVTANTMRLYRVDRYEGGRLMGRNDPGDYAGVIIPYFLPEDNTVRENRLRLDTDIELWDKSGNKKRKVKYLSPIGDRGRLYFPLGIRREWLEDISIPILFVEGEKKAAACQRAANLGRERPKFITIGIPGVDGWKGTVQKPTSHNGQVKITGALPDLDGIAWEGRNVFILFDADITTNKNVLHARRRLRDEVRGRNAEAMCVDMPADSGCKGIDDLLGKISRELSPASAAKQLVELLDRSYLDHRESSEILPLPPVLSPVPRLDEQLIPEPLRPWLTDIAERMQCPLEFPVIAALTAIGSVIGNEVCVKPKERDSWIECPNLWGAIVGDPGVMKSPAVSEAMQFLREIEKREDELFKDQNPEHAFDLASREAEKKAIKQQLEKYYRPKQPKPVSTETLVDKAVDLEALKKRFKELESMPEPKPKRLTTSDATIEKLGELLNENLRGLLNNRDELAGFFANMEKPGREGDRAFFLEAWNGLSNFRVDRIGRGCMHIENMTLSIFGTIQPTVIEPHLSAVGSRKDDDGLMQRFQLLVFPDLPTEYTYIDRPPEDVTVARNIFNTLYRMKAEDVNASRLVDGAGGHAFLKFDPDAQVFFEKWFTELEHDLRSGSIVSRSLKSHVAKYRGLMPSLALIFHLIDRASGEESTAEISLKNAELAAAWCSFLRRHAERLYSMGNLSGIKAAHEILVRIDAGDLGNQFSARSLYRKGWKNLSEQSVVKCGLDTLAAHGHIEEVFVPTDGKHKVIYVVNKRLR